MGKKITGKEQVSLVLTVDEVGFIASGLRDLAQQLQKTLPMTTREEQVAWFKMIEENQRLADKLERDMLEGL